jgi:hypothetical protein
MARLNSLQRLTKRDTRGVGTEFFSPDQQQLRDRAKSLNGVFADDPTKKNRNPMSKVTVYPDGTCDVTSLENDEDGWFDLGGRGGIDFAAGR